MHNPRFKISNRVLHLSKELEKNFILKRKPVTDRPQGLHPTSSPHDTRGPMPTAETLYTPFKLGPGDLKANTDGSQFRIAIPTPLLNGTKTNRVAPEPNGKAKVGKAKNAFICGPIPGTERDAMVEANPLDDSIVGANNRAIKQNTGGVTYNNNLTMNIQLKPRFRSTRALGVSKRNIPKDENKE